MCNMNKTNSYSRLTNLAKIVLLLSVPLYLLINFYSEKKFIKQQLEKNENIMDNTRIKVDIQNQIKKDSLIVEKLKL